MTRQSEWVRVADVQQLAQWGIVGAKIGDDYVAVCEVNGVLYAISDLCTHAFALLSDGYLEGHKVECPLHGACFDVRTGKGLEGPVGEDIRTYAVRRNGADIEVAIGAVE